MINMENILDDKPDILIREKIYYDNQEILTYTKCML